MIKQLILELKQVDPKDTCRFTELVRNFLEVLSLEPKDINREFSCTITTVKRWVNGTAAPHPAMRPYVYKFFIKELEKKL